MTSALFTFTVRGKYKTKEGKVVEYENLNFLNPMHVISAYWSVTEAGARILNVFTSGASQDPVTGQFRPGRTFTFTERQGQRCIDHLEDFLRYNMMPLDMSQTQPAPTRQSRRNEDHSRGRRPMELVEETIVDDELDSALETTGAVFES